MNYEKAYKEAIDKLKNLQKSWASTQNRAAKEIEDAFPELKESDDARILQMIKNTLREAAISERISETSYGEMLAYLEQQKEQKSVQDKEEREYVRTLKSLIADFLRGKDEVDRGYYQKIYDWLDGRHIEQQPSTAEDIAAAYQMGLAEGRKEQKPAEWSEEDEDGFKCIANCLSSFYALTDDVVQRDKIDSAEMWLNERLKSIRPQPHWKPSEEQMGWLESAVRLSTDKPHIHGIIISLYEQLKRL